MSGECGKCGEHTLECSCKKNKWKSFSSKKPPVNKRVVIQREHNKKMVVARFKKQGPRTDLPPQELWHTEHGSYYLIDPKDIWILIPGLE